MRARNLFLTTAAAALLANVVFVGSDADAQGPGGGWCQSASKADP
jgi:hypothetical protein